MRVFCPHCRTEHEIPDNLAGTRVRCANPACQKPFAAPATAKKSTGARTSAPSWPGVSDHPSQTPSDSGAAAKPAAAVPPPLSGSDRSFDVDTESPRRSAEPSGFMKRVQRLNLSDMVLGKEKEYVFPLLPGEERLEELTIRHQHLFVVQSGVTRVTLTTHRLLCTKTKVFSPAYWLLLAILGFTPLIYYYAFRISRNRNVSMPLGSIDSADKRYRPNWLLLIVAVIAASIVVNLCARAVTAPFGPSREETSARGDDAGNPQYPGFFVPSRTSMQNDDSTWPYVFALFVLWGLLAPALLVLLLATRGVAIVVYSQNNKFWFGAGHADTGGSEEGVDAFLLRVHAQMERAGLLRAAARLPAIG